LSPGNGFGVRLGADCADAPQRRKNWGAIGENARLEHDVDGDVDIPQIAEASLETGR
jgi:hypothetical protein